MALEVDQQVLGVGEPAPAIIRAWKIDKIKLNTFNVRTFFVLSPHCQASLFNSSI